MKSLKDYLTESKKTYSFRIKVAGPVPEKFVESLKGSMEKYGCGKLDKVSETPIQSTALEFPQLRNIEVTMFEAECSYPVTPQEISVMVKDSTGTPETHYRVRSLQEDDIVFSMPETSDKALLNDSELKDATKVKTKDYFGDDFNRSFLKDLEKTSKDRKKDQGQGEYKLPKSKDKGNTKSAIGS